MRFTSVLAAMAMAVLPAAAQTAPHFVFALNGSNTISGFTVDPAQGGLTAHTPMPTNGTATASAVDPLGQFLYVAETTRRIEVFRIDPSTGALTVTSGSP